MLKFYNKWHRTAEMKSNKNKGRKKKPYLHAIRVNRSIAPRNSIQQKVPRKPKLSSTLAGPQNPQIHTAFLCEIKTRTPNSWNGVPQKRINETPFWDPSKKVQKSQLISFFLSNLTEEGFFLHLIGEERSNFSVRFDLARWLGDWRAYNRRRSEGLEGPIDEKSPIFRIERVSKSDRERESFCILLQAPFNKRRRSIRKEIYIRICM